MRRLRRQAIAALVLAGALVPLALAGCGGDDGGEAAPPPPPPAEEPPAEPPAEEPPAEEPPAEEPPAGEGDPAAGEQVFADAGCGTCHVLAAAGASGVVGPNLDEAQPSFEATVEQVTNGGGGMPAFGDSLSEQQIQDVAAYVVASTGG